MTELEDARVRVARAEDAKAKLHEQIMKKHGSIAELDAACRTEKTKDSCARYNGKAHKLRQDYNAAVKELRLATSELKRMRNEAEQKGEVSVSVNGGPEAPAGSPEASAAVGSVMQHIAERIEEGEAARRERGVQHNLEGEPADVVSTDSETKEYRIFMTEDFRVKVSEDALEKLLEKKDNEKMAWVQSHMRLLDPKHPVPPGVFDRDAKALYAKIRMAYL